MICSAAVKPAGAENTKNCQVWLSPTEKRSKRKRRTVNVRTGFKKRRNGDEDWGMRGKRKCDVMGRDATSYSQRKMVGDTDVCMWSRAGEAWMETGLVKPSSRFLVGAKVTQFCARGRFMMPSWERNWEKVSCAPNLKEKQDDPLRHAICPSTNYTAKTMCDHYWPWFVTLSLQLGQLKYYIAWYLVGVKRTSSFC